MGPKIIGYLYSKNVIKELIIFGPKHKDYKWFTNMGILRYIDNWESLIQLRHELANTKLKYFLGLDNRYHINI